MTINTITWDSLRNELLADSEIKTEYDALSPEFELARTIISLREETDLTQREFAAKVGMKQSQLARIESGKQTPKLKTLAKFAIAAGYDIELNFIPIKGKRKTQVKPMRFTCEKLLNS